MVQPSARKSTSESPTTRRGASLKHGTTITSAVARPPVGNGDAGTVWRPERITVATEAPQHKTGSASFLKPERVARLPTVGARAGQLPFAVGRSLGPTGREFIPSAKRGCGYCDER